MNDRNDKPTDDFIFGIRAVLEAIRFGKDIDKVLIKRGPKGDLIKELQTVINEDNISFQYVPEEKLNRLTRKNHQGVIALMSPITFYGLEDTITAIFEKGEIPFILALDEVSDVRNFGAIVRTAECAGVNAIVIPEKGSARIGSDAIKTSAGALHKMPVCRVPNLKKAMEYLQLSGLVLFGATEKAIDNYYQSDFSGPLCIIMGSEDTGLSNEIIRFCDNLIKIPILGKIQSLNVSVAASVLIYDVVRQRMNQLNE
ncbi:MAG: 23S rRNA (guanosine(2251)-2'-O)-methyltransferase RlmB [Salinivirgaceae bacterium]|jgi:23S rRNA (guanosine2251-2'-O)-methyltransferase|nr:23S rRNA (guanosine(2251)-2'-O)-methyltransferase RlmB [Salinivirgaceae bacterium]